MNKNGIVYTILFAFIATFVLVVPLALANQGTKPIVIENQKTAASKAVLGALGQDLTGKDQATILTMYAELERLRWNGTTWQNDTSLPPESSELLYRWRQNTGEIRYARFYSGPGLWGTITATVGFVADGSRITGVRIYAQVETPGLGSRIEEPWYLEQFRDQLATQPLVFNAIASPRGDLQKDDANIDGISGATRSSEGIKAIINSAIIDIQKQIPGVQP
jgi:Na+-transporting NADH:ubiquinone oxidoreductase subunit C